MFTPANCNSHNLKSESSPLWSLWQFKPWGCFQTAVSWFNFMVSSLSHQALIQFFTYQLSIERSDWSFSQHCESLTPDPFDPMFLKTASCRVAAGLEVTWPLVRMAPCPPASCPSAEASDADGDVAAGRRAAFDARAARSGLGLTAAQRAQQQPQVEDHTGPAGRHLHPEGRPAAVGEGGLQHRRFIAGVVTNHPNEEGNILWEDGCNIIFTISQSGLISYR